MKPKPTSAFSGAAGLTQTEIFADSPGANINRSNDSLMSSDPWGSFTAGGIPSGNLCKGRQKSLLRVMVTFELFTKTQSLNFQPIGQGGHFSLLTLVGTKSSAE